MRSIVRFFASVRLAIILLIILAAASVLGTLIPQGRGPAEYAARYGTLAPLFERLQLIRLYHSIWYMALLALFGLNLVICTLTRLGPKTRKAFRPQVVSDPKVLQGLRLKGKIRKSVSEPEVQALLTATLRAAGYRVRAAAEGQRTCLLARKRLLGYFGSDIVHIGLLVILFGGILSGLFGFRTEIALAEGETKGVQRAGYALRLEKFATEFYPDGSVKGWKSTVSVLDNGAPSLTGTIEVNHPLSYKGFSFYQSSYGYDWDSAVLELRAQKKDDPSFSQVLKVKVGTRVPLGDGGKTEIFVSRFLPDFVLGEGNEPQTRSLQPNNPAALIEGWRAGAKVFEGWVFANYPDFASMHGGSKVDLSFELKNVAAGQHTILEAASDPGVVLIWLGCALGMAGLFLAFYWPTWEVRATLEPGQGQTDVTVGGIAAKSRDGFAAEFEKILGTLRRGN